MREIKFRVFDNRRKKYLKSTDIRINCGNGFLCGKYSDGDVKEWKAEQYTGLKDKKDIEIYEGDILSVVDGNGDPIDSIEVKWNNDACSWVIEYDFDDYQMTTIGWAMDLGFSFEIIGNIYENKDLLNVH